MKVLYEDNHLIAVEKRRGQLSQGDETGDFTLMDETKQYIKEKYNKPGDVFLGCIHRLDRVTSGLIIYTKTSKALTRMNNIIKDRKIKKFYYAILQGRPDFEKGRLVHYLRKNKKANFVTVSDVPKPEAKKAELSYSIIAQLDSFSLAKIEIHTGRPHQIRAQFAYMGTPVAGDTKYRANKRLELPKGIYLHAHELLFEHPVKKEKLRITSTPSNEGLWKDFKVFF